MAVDQARIPAQTRRNRGELKPRTINTSADAANNPIGPPDTTASAAVAAPGDIEPHHSGYADTTPPHDTVGYGGGGYGGGGATHQASSRPPMWAGLLALVAAGAFWFFITLYTNKTAGEHTEKRDQHLESPAGIAETAAELARDLQQGEIRLAEIRLKAAEAAKTTSVTMGSVTPGLPPMTVTDNPRPQRQAPRDMGFQYTAPAQGAHHINNPGGIRYAILRAGTNDACTNNHQFVVEKNATRWHVNGLNPTIEADCTQWLAMSPGANLYIIAEGSGLEVIPRK